MCPLRDNSFNLYKEKSLLEKLIRTLFKDILNENLYKLSKPIKEKCMKGKK
jgi:hypothetical protein